MTISELFNLFQSGMLIKKNEDNENKIDILHKQGLIYFDMSCQGYFLNPLFKNCKSYDSAKRLMKEHITQWSSTYKYEEEYLAKTRREQINFFKANPCTTHMGYWMMPENTPDLWKNGRGKAYIFEGDILSLHTGYRKPKRFPIGCIEEKIKIVNGKITLDKN